ncbi:exopolyphosphatase [Pistricoccus aurantiacus]|uniref:Ppx/GppA phosphatase family protein n=1 Tax=Pistricoccus aurantiacus TaxID=1883414 RepID=UPI003630492D
MTRPTPFLETPGLQREPHLLAAIDLGSNSFHLLVAHDLEGRLQVITKRGEKVQLGSGLDEEGRLSDDAIQRALDCLAHFAPCLEGVPMDRVRIVGTNALRNAVNSQALIEPAEALLGHPIEIIAGREEARLIYLGVAHDVAETEERRLIVDIGGGSTEYIIGEGFKPLALESLDMGCVSYTRQFFDNGTSGGEINAKRFRQAELSALSELAPIRPRYRALGWQDPIGASGSIKAIGAVLAASGECPEGIIEREGLEALRERLIVCGRLDRVEMAGLKADRANILPAGVAILGAIFEAFELEHMRYSDGALREGVLYDLLKRSAAETPHPAILDKLRKRYGIDGSQGDNVAACARHCLDQVQDSWRIPDEAKQLLWWAAQLHEIGQAISYHRFHRHGQYLLTHSDLSGFSLPQQRAMAFLVRAHRRRFPLQDYQALPDRERRLLGRLARLLRLAAIFHHSRPARSVSAFRLACDENDALQLTLSTELAAQALLIHDLEREIAYQDAAGFRLSVNVANASRLEYS